MEEMDIIDFDEENIEDTQDMDVTTDADTDEDQAEHIEDFLARQNGKKKRKRQKSDKGHRGRGILIALLTVSLLAGIGVGGYYVYEDYTGRVYSHCVIEAGDVEVTPEDFLKNQTKVVTFTEGYDVSAIDTTTPGDYDVELTSGMYKYKSILTVEDTTAPVGSPRALTLEYGETAEPVDFAEDIYDVTKVSVEYAEAPDFTKGGESEVTIILTDTSGNATSLKSTLNILPVHREVVIESGDELPGLTAFLLDELAEDNASAKLLTDMDEIDTYKPGDYPIEISFGNSVYTSVLSIVDTVPPVIETKDFTGFTTSVITPDILIESAEDVTELTYSFKEEPDLSREGVQEVTVVATDMGGNTAEGTSMLTLALDTEAPVIEGAKDITIMQNYPISYREGITVTDNCDEDIQLKIDASGVKSKQIGEYPITYTATDRAGNTAEVTITLNIIEEHYDEATVYAYASQVLASITTPEMNDLEKMTAIYRWVKRIISYTESDNKTDWTKAAYYGLVLHKGDCYSYCMTSKALLDVAGIKNMVIDTYPLRDIHFWNLVDIGEGWRHFDTTPRIGGGDFLYMDDATITAYSVTHGNSHIYDRTRFPGIQ